MKPRPGWLREPRSAPAASPSCASVSHAMPSSSRRRSTASRRSFPGFRRAPASSIRPASRIAGIAIVLRAEHFPAPGFVLIRTRGTWGGRTAQRGRPSMTVDNTGSGEVFIVDDDPLVLNALSIVLSRAGYQVTGFAEGASFLAAARSRNPLCVILDVHMPGQSGLDLLKELNAQHYPAPIFIISGAGDIPMAVEAIKNGAFDFFEKPFDATTVVTRVREATEAWARRGKQVNGADSLPRTF